MIGYIVSYRIGKLSAGRDFTEQHAGCSRPADHSALPNDHKRVRSSFGTVHERQVYYAADIEQHGHFSEMLTGFFQHIQFGIGKVVGAFFKLVVLLLAGSSSDDRYRADAFRRRSFNNIVIKRHFLL